MSRKRARTKPRQAPGDLPLVVDFLNTFDAAKSEDSWTDAAALGRWLEQRGLALAPQGLGEEDLRRAVAARRLLRALFLANSGGELDEKHVVALDRLAAECSCQVRFGAGAAARLEHGSASLEGVLGRLFGILWLAQNSEAWPRLKICASPSCRKAYFDASRRRPSPCCSRKCSNNLSARHYRRRYKARHGHMPRGGRYR